MNKSGKIRITQRLVPCAPCILAIPRMAISELVSNPSPNRTPRGYIYSRVNMLSSIK